jgi:hypothetical protein
MKRILLVLAILAAPAGARKFLTDDPLLKEPPPRDVGKPKSRKLSDYYDLFMHQFGKPGERQPESPKKPRIRAQAVNTLGDPMDGDWYTRRHYWNRMSREDLQRGSGNDDACDMSDRWTVIGVKSEGITPGFVVLDAKKRRYFVKFDPISNPEIATAADQISSKIMHALGYWVPENYLVYIKDDILELGENVELSDRLGKKRKMTRRDLMEILLKVPRTKDGKYRATASLELPGKTIGPPRYFGTRKDDPNDVVPHEHRRDQRALQVFCAWLGHDDSRAINNMDVVVDNNGVKSIRHYLLDLGSTLGSASTGPNSARSGDYFFSWSESAKNLFGLGFRVPYWARAEYPNYPSIGRFEWKQFDPEKWVPEYPNPAFLNRLPDDEFWAAKQVMAFSDEDLKAVVDTGELSDPKAAAYLLECLIKRRDKIGQAYYEKVLPLDRFVLRDGVLAWQDLAGSSTFALQWNRFNNDTLVHTPIRGATAPRIPDFSGGEFLSAEFTQLRNRAHKIFVYLRSRAGKTEIVGIDREW